MLFTVCSQCITSKIISIRLYSIQTVTATWPWVRNGWKFGSILVCLKLFELLCWPSLAAYLWLQSDYVRVRFKISILLARTLSLQRNTLWSRPCCRAAWLWESVEECLMCLVSGGPEDFWVALAGYVCQDRKGKLILLAAWNWPTLRKVSLELVNLRAPGEIV